MSTPFAELLKQRRPALWAALAEIHRRALEEWIHHLKVDKGSHAGFVHLRGVENNADKMIPQESKEKFTDGEIFLLLASILLHDLGRILPDPEAPAVKRCPFADNRMVCRDKIRRGKAQGTHACWSRSLIETVWAILGLPDSHIAEYSALISFWHQLTKPPEHHKPKDSCRVAYESRRYFCETSLEPYGRLRIPLIAAILRLADEAEDSWTRAFRQHWHDLMIEERGPKNLEKAFRRGVEDVAFFPRSECVVMYIPALPNPREEWDRKFLKKLANKAADTCEALEEWGDLLAPAEVSYRYLFVDKGGRLWRVQRRSGKRNNSPTRLFEDISLRETLEQKASQGLREPYLEVGSIQRYYDGIVRLVQGTRGYRSYRWSSVEGAIGEPLTAKVRWAIGRLGKLPGALRIMPRLDSEELDIVYDNRWDLLQVTANQLGVKVK